MRRVAQVPVYPIVDVVEPLLGTAVPARQIRCKVCTRFGMNISLHHCGHVRHPTTPCFTRASEFCLGGSDTHFDPLEARSFLGAFLGQRIRAYSGMLCAVSGALF